MVVYGWIILKLRNISDKIYRENKNSDFVFNIYTRIFFSDCIVYKIMWKNMAEPCRQQIIIQYGACALHYGKNVYRHTQNI